jgi:hypothetical protein
MLLVSIVLLIGFVLIVERVSTLKFGGISIPLLMFASILILIERIGGMNFLKKTDAKFAHLPSDTADEMDATTIGYFGINGNYPSAK